MKKLIRKGKVKEVFQISQSELEFHFSDNISVFDKIVPNEIPRKGESLCKTSAYWLEKAEELGFKTHFIEMSEEDKMKVKSVEMIEDYDEIDQGSTDYRIPLEFITRYHVADSLHERIQDGKISYEELGFDEEPDYGERLAEPFFEIRTKVEENRRILDREEALSNSGLAEEELERIKDIVLDIDEYMKDTVEDNGLILVESEKEFALTEERELMLVDSFGTADEGIFWDAEEYDKGNFVQKNKELIRNHYKDNGYYDKLFKAREKGNNETSIPPLPDELIEKSSRIYMDMMSRLTDGTYGDRI